MKTKIIAVLLTASILFSFAACGKTAADTTTSAATTIQTTVQAGGTTAAEATTATGTTQTQTDSQTGASTTAATTKATTQATTTAPAVKTFTKTELAKFDGKSGRDAYIAYNGIVYDVTGNNSWKNGNHKFVLYAGNDLTAKVNSCTEHAQNFMAAQFSTYPQVGVYTG